MKPMNKKLFTSTFGIFSLLSALFFSSCNQAATFSSTEQPDQETSVKQSMSENEWNAAVSLHNFENFTMIAENPTDIDYTTASFIPTTTKYTSDKIQVAYYANEELREQVFEGEQIVQLKSDSLGAIFVLLDYDLFSYNAKVDIYEAKNVDAEALLSPYYEEIYGSYNGQFSQVYSNFTAKFTDGKLSKLDCYHNKQTETGFIPYGAAKYTFYDYGNTVITTIQS